MRNGKIGLGAGQWTQRTINFDIEGKVYPISYIVTREGQNWIINSQVSRSADFKHDYNLRAGGQRAFPHFIRGFGGR